MKTLVQPEFIFILLAVVGAIFVHMCYQLSVNVLTLLSSHTIGRDNSYRRLSWLGFFYVAGVILATTAGMLMTTAFINWLWSFSTPAHLRTLAIFMTVLPVIGIITMFYYFRKGPGTKLWLPKPFSDYLSVRAKKTKSGVEAMMLGIATVIGELPFIVGPMAIVSLVIVAQWPQNWLIASKLYAVIVALPLVFIIFYLTSGHSLARVQKWREDNKHFLQITSGIALILLTAYITILQAGVLR